jgi:alcohol dehydrogenase (cytochrome c)
MKCFDGQLLVGCLLVGLAFASGADTGMPTYPLVTDARLRDPESENWLMWRGNYASWGYSPLAQITKDNVRELKLAWSFSTNAAEGHEAAPIVNGDWMFVSTPEHQVIAINARTGEEIWRYRKEVDDDHYAMHPTNRGVALYGDKVFLAANDACAIALDAQTGEQLWENCLADWKLGFHMTLAPLAVEGRIMFGLSGAEFGVRCFIAALDADTGKELWRTYTIPAPGEPGADTWRGDDWKRGGGSVWMTGSYDPETKLAFFGTGNPGPWLPDLHPGDNLYTNSVLAIEVATGAIKGYHQYHPNDGWDWDEVSTPLLVDLDHDGKRVKGLVHAGRNGYLWFLERRSDGRIGFVDAKPYVYNSVITGIDPKSGRPSYDPATIPKIGKTVTFCPSVWGAKDWPPEAWNPVTRLLYIPAHDHLCSELTGIPVEYQPGKEYMGFAGDDLANMIRFRPAATSGPDASIGEIQAWDLAARNRVWTHRFRDMNWGPVLTTAGELVFSGGTNDREFRALDALTGAKLWSMRLNSGVIGIPVSYSIEGIQYIAVQAGWGVDAQTMQGSFNARRPYRQTVPQGGAIWVFALESRRKQ